MAKSSAQRQREHRGRMKDNIASLFEYTEVYLFNGEVVIEWHLDTPEKQQAVAALAALRGESVDDFLEKAGRGYINQTTNVKVSQGHVDDMGLVDN